MKRFLLAAGLLVCLSSSSVFAAQFDCFGKTRDENGNWAKAEVTIDLDEGSVNVQEDGTQFGFAMRATYDSDYRPSIKYAGYYRYNSSVTSEGWNHILIQKPMRDNKRAKSGAVVIQGTEEDGGTAAYFDICTRVN